MKGKKWKLSPELKLKIQLLNPDKPQEIAVQRFVYQRFRLSLSVLISILFLAALVFLKQIGKETDENMICRGDYGEASRIITKKFRIGDLEERELDIEVFAREYSKEQADKIFHMIKIKLPQIILGDNLSLDEIRKPLHLIRNFKEKGISINWSSNNDEVIQNDGSISNREIGDEGRTVELDYRIQCGEYIYQDKIKAKVLPPILTKEEAIEESLYNKIDRTEANSRAEESYFLPSEINGMTVKWNSKEKETIIPLIVLAILLSIIVYYLQEKRLEEKLKQRKRQLLSDYYEIANKIILYTEAGVSSKTAFGKITEDYLTYKQKEKLLFRYAYEELLIMCREIQSGVSELEAYENCGKRCELMQYKKLFGYLAQSIKKGSGFVIEKLKSEMQDAFEDRKANAVRMGEEASTKLMLPMLMMLGVVIAVLMVPAFIAFGI